MKCRIKLIGTGHALALRSADTGKGVQVRIKGSTTGALGPVRGQPSKIGRAQSKPIKNKLDLKMVAIGLSLATTARAQTNTVSAPPRKSKVVRA